MTKSTTTQITFNLFGKKVSAHSWQTKTKSRVYIEKSDLFAFFGISFDEFSNLESRLKMDKDSIRIGSALVSKDFYFDEKSNEWSELANFWLEDEGFINPQSAKDAILEDQTNKFNEVVEKIGREKAVDILEDTFPRHAHNNMKAFLAGESAANAEFFNDFFSYAIKQEG